MERGPVGNSETSNAMSSLEGQRFLLLSTLSWARTLGDHQCLGTILLTRQLVGLPGITILYSGITNTTQVLLVKPHVIQYFIGIF